MTHSASFMTALLPGRDLTRSASFVLILFLAFHPGVSAQEGSGGQRAVRAQRVDDGQIDLDGRFDEAAWTSAQSVSGFTQRDPDDGSPATERTEVRVLYSTNAIYVAVRAFDSTPAEIRSVLSRRDVELPSDRIAILFDSYDDRRTSFAFVVTPHGAIQDKVMLNDGDFGDASWDPVWDVATARDDQGWSAEFRIPFSQLRFDAESTSWGFQVGRRVERKAEDSWWAPYSKTGNGFASRFGRVEGLDDLPSPKRLEVSPYTILDGRFQPEGTGSVFSPAHSAGVDAGLDLKLGISSDFTLDLTANPDFGQVEADPSVVNLSAFETFLPERRPFFVEGAGLLPQGRLFYSRRIGRSPQGSAQAPTGGTIELPEEATILTAAKLTGKSGGLGLGVMSALTSSEQATLRDAAGNETNGPSVEPLTHYFAGRAARDFSAAHTMGLSATAVNRRLGSDFPTLRSAGYAAELNGSHRWKNNEYNISWNVSATHIQGSTQAITNAQLSSLRYYQRPDADHVQVDSTLTSLSGYAFGLDVGKHAGSIRAFTGYSYITPGFDSNDMGFHGRVDQQFLYGGGQYVRNRPIGPFRQFGFGPDFNSTWSTSGEIEGTWFRPLFFYANLRNNWWFNFNPFAFTWNQFSPTALRGGPGLVNDTWHNSFVNAGSDGRKPLSWNISANLGGMMEQESRFWGLFNNVNVRASNVLSGSVGVGVNGRMDEQEWVGRRLVRDSTHYIIGTIDQTTLSVTTRLDWTMSPRLSLQLYAQPFVSAGSYADFREVTNPRGETLAERFRAYGNRLSCGDSSCSVDVDSNGATDFTFGRPDFRAKELNSTMILRWEYRSGSVLYVGWQHGRSGFEQDGTFRGGRDLVDLLDLPSQNTLLVKLNYWVSF
jgi:hypothetical protein